jgi:hypothetical protein
MTGAKNIMETYSYGSRNALILIAAWPFLSGYSASKAISADPQPRRYAAAPSAFARPANGAAV